MDCKERRARDLVERKRLKKGRKSDGLPARGPLPLPARDADDDNYAWMAGLLPADGGRALEVGGGVRTKSALTRRGWKVVSIEPSALLAEGEFAGDPVEAVTCWLLETRSGRPEMMERFGALGLRTPDERRLAVHTLVYRLADRVLSVGGVLQIVDPTSQVFDEALAGGMVRLQRAQARGTRLEFAALDARPHREGALVSVRSRKAG